MFTGLIESKGTVLAQSAQDSHNLKVRISRPSTFKDLIGGESIAVNGTCLTLTEFTPNSMDFFVSSETLGKTTFSALKVDDELNLERSLRMGDRLGGHMVTGHVDGVAKVTKAKKDGECFALSIQVSPEQYKFIIPKGSICINGVSLTVNELDRDLKTVGLYLIPETLARTNLGTLTEDSPVNVECDQTVKILAYLGNV